MVLGIIALVFIVTVVFCSVCVMHKHRLDASLKRDLLDRGLSADEIAAVIRARPTKRDRGHSPGSISNRSHVS
jgi:hypothetical protein